MSKRDRHLKQRLDELFSPAPEPAETQPEESAAEPEAVSSRSGRPVEPAAAAAPERPYLKDLIDQLPLPAYLKDREHTWVAVNAAFAQLIGRTPEMLLGRADKEQADDAHPELAGLCQLAARPPYEEKAEEAGDQPHQHHDDGRYIRACLACR